MSMFVKLGDTVPITVDGGVNVINILPKLNFGVRNKVLSAIAKASMSVGGDDDSPTVGLDFGALQTALMVNFVVSWHGPAFVDDNGQPIACTTENILAMDTDEPLVDALTTEIYRRWNEKPSPDPKSAATTGSVSVGSSSSEAASESLVKTGNSSHKRRATTTPMSSSLNN